MLSATKRCQLDNWNYLAVYSFLIYRAGQTNRSAKISRIATNLRISRESVRNSLAILTGRDLVEKLPNGRYAALEPSVEAWAWFEVKKTINTENWPWWQRFATFPYYVTAKGGLSPRASATLWKIHSWNTGPYPMTIKVGGLVTQSLIARRSVIRHIKVLKAKGLLDASLRLTLTEDTKRYWLDRNLPPKKTVKPEVRISLRSLVALWYEGRHPAIHQDYDVLNGRLDLFENAMKSYGFDQKQINEFWMAVVTEWLGGNLEHFEAFLLRFATVLKFAQQTHETNGHPYPTCLGLLKQLAQGGMSRFAELCEEWCGRHHGMGAANAKVF